MPELIHVAVGVVVGTDQKILIARRPPQVHQGGLWEFPGGKLEHNETVLKALQRELQEELGIDIDPDSCFPLKKFLHRYSDRTVLLDTWRVDSYRGEPIGREQQAVAWESVEALNPHQFPAANHAIIDCLQLPEKLAITGPAEDRTAFRNRLQGLLAKGLKLVQFRQPALADRESLDWAQEAKRLCQEHGARLLLNGSVEAYSRVGADGLHVNATRLLELENRPVDKASLFSASCHNLTELRKAEQLDADFALLSPVSTTPTHPTVKPLGWEQFRYLGSQVSIPVYALGGMRAADLAAARREGGHGIAGISAFW